MPDTGYRPIVKVGCFDSDVKNDINRQFGELYDRTLVFGVVIDGAGSVITTGQHKGPRIPRACQITGWTILSVDGSAGAPTAGSIVVDLWVDTFANYPPTVADTVTGSAKPTLTAGIAAESDVLTGWTTAIQAGSCVVFNVDSVTSLKKVYVQVTARLT